MSHHTNKTIQRTTRSTTKSKQPEIIDLTSTPPTRSTSLPSPNIISALPSPLTLTFATPASQRPEDQSITFFPSTSKLPCLSHSSLALLRAKQRKLGLTASTTLSTLSLFSDLTSNGSRNTLPQGVKENTQSSPLQNALLSTLIFSSEEAGTAVLIHEDGWVLTCSHCFAESREEWEGICLLDAQAKSAGESWSKSKSNPKQAKMTSKDGREEDNGKKKWLLSYDGTAICVECIIWDGHRDLALCRVIGVERTPPSSSTTDFPSPTQKHAETHASPKGAIFCSLKVAEIQPKVRGSLWCIGQPGAEDLESSTPNKPTKYSLIEISRGHYRGLIKGKDVNDNEEIGCLMHDAWTYWGHSGAPLISFHQEGEAKLIGLHSSWDDQTAMRHGIPGEAIRSFLRECGEEVGVDFGVEYGSGYEAVSGNDW